MNIKVENLGALKTAETDLSKNLIVYSGKNNSGKTYMLNLVYGLQQFALDLHFQELYKLIKNFISKDFDAAISALSGTGETKIDISFLNDEKVKEQFINLYLNNHFKWVFPSLSLTPSISYELDKNFKNVNYYSFYSFYSHLIGYLDISYQHPYLYFKAEDEFDNKNSYYQTKEFFTDGFISDIDFFLKNILNFGARIIFFTTERVASLTFGRDIYKYKAKQNLENKDNGKNKNGIPDYPLAILKELEYINNFDINRTNLSDYGYLADELETLIGGKIAANQDGLLLFKEGRTSYLVTNSSSTVKSLATLVFYLRHTAQKGDCIIIDEPELSLHPDNQRKIARFLARCVNEGFKVIISTHSDYIINEINNLITLHKHKDKPRTKSIMKKHDYKANQTLDYQQVGAYLFKDNHCTKIEVGETGFAVETINEAMGNLYKASDSIFQDFEVENANPNKNG